jgi:hypothetical protein
MGLKQNDRDKVNLDPGPGPTIIMFAAIGIAMFLLSFF